MVLMVYGGLFLVFFVAMGMFGGSNEAVPTTATPQKKVEQNKTEEAKTTSADVKYTYDDAKKRLADWLGDHMFENVTSIKLSDGPTDGSMYKLEGKGNSWKFKAPVYENNVAKYEFNRIIYK